MANKQIEPADRLSLVQEYYFSRKLKEVAQMNAEGKDIISLAIGSPDMPPSEQTIQKLCEVAKPTSVGMAWNWMVRRRCCHLSVRRKVSCMSPSPS